MPILRLKRRVGRSEAGTVAKFTSYETRALVALGYAEPFVAAPVQPAAAFTQHEQAPAVNEARPKRAYRRRDMVADVGAIEAPPTAAVENTDESDA